MSPAIDRPNLGFRWVDRENVAEGTRFTVEIPAECPAFHGHFADRPILPAVAQLASVEEGIAQLNKEDRPLRSAIAEISGLRLRRTVGPGERLTLWIGAANEKGMHRFEIRSEGNVVSGGSVRVEEKLAGEPGAPAVEIDCEAVPAIPALGRVPHSPPALLIDSLVARGPSGARGRGLIPANSPFAAAGNAPSYLGLEIAAQTAALVEALGREEEAAPRVGYLVAIRQARCYLRSLPVGEPLDVVVLFAGSAPPLSIYEIRIEREGRLLVDGTISTWIGEGES